MEINEKIKSLNLVINRISSLSKQFIQKQGLNEYVIKTLYVLSSGNAVTQKEICKISGIPKQTVNNAIHLLTSDGLVILKNHAGDKREKEVILTEKGRAYLDETLPQIMDMQLKIIHRIGEDCFDSMVDALEKYSEAMQEIVEEKI